MQAILRHLGLDGRYLGDLVPAGLRVVAVQVLAALPAGGRLHRNGLLDLRGGYQGPLLPSVARLPAPLATRRWFRRPAFDVRRVARRWAGRVRGVLIQAFGKLSDLLLEGLQALFVSLDKGQDRRLGGRRYLAPEFSRDRRNRQHTNILRPLKGPDKFRA